MQNHITIKYCTQCQWMLRATWIAQEILSTFEEDISTISLDPGKGGVFEIQVNEILIWSLKKERKFPQPKDFKKRIRDIISPDKPLPHSDRNP